MPELILALDGTGSEEGMEGTVCGDAPIALLVQVASAGERLSHA